MGTLRRHHILIGAAIAATLLAGSVCLGADETVLFERAYRSFMAYQPEKAVEGFNAFIKEFPQSSALDAAFFWKGKALAQAGRTEEARELLSSLAGKFPESPFLRFTEDAISEIKEGGGTKNRDQRIDKNNKAGKALSDKLRILEARIAGLERENRSAKKSLADAAAEKGRLVKELEETRQRAADLSGKLAAAEAGRPDREAAGGERAGLEARVRELEARLAATAEERRIAEEKAKVLAGERDEALVSARSGELPSSIPAAGGALIAREKELREFNEYVKRVKELESEKKLLQEKWEKYRQEKEKELKDLTAQREGSRRQVPAAGQQDQALDDLQKRLAAAEQRARESAEREKAAADEKALLSARLKEAEQKLTGMTALRNEVEQERARTLKAEQELERFLALRKNAAKSPAKEEGKGGETPDEAAAVKTRELSAENSALRQRLARFERPVVKVAGKTFSQAEIDDDRAVAARVLGRIGTASVPWHTGNAYEDFVAERVLAARAGKGDPQKAADDAADLARRHSFTAQEQAYLHRFLAADAEVKRRMEYPGDEDLRNYYEAHRSEFAAGKGERMVQYLTVRLGSGDRAAGVQLVSDLQREAMAGKPMEDIARGRGGKVSYTLSRIKELPAWIGEKVKRIREGAISSIFTEDQFILLQVVTRREMRAFDQVKGEIRKRLAGGVPDIAAWLAAARKEAEDLR